MSRKIRSKSADRSEIETEAKSYASAIQNYRPEDWLKLQEAIQHIPICFSRSDTDN